MEGVIIVGILVAMVFTGKWLISLSKDNGEDQDDGTDKHLYI